MLNRLKSRGVIPVVVLLLIGGTAAYLLASRSRDRFIAYVSVDLRVLCQQTYFYRKDTGHWPDSLYDLRDCPKDLPGWRGPYILTRPADPWGRDYLFFKNDGVVVIATFGEDGQPGGEGPAADRFLAVRSPSE